MRLKLQVHEVLMGHPERHMKESNDFVDLPSAQVVDVGVVSDARELSLDFVLLRFPFAVARSSAQHSRRCEDVVISSR
jgi:hypothetical protein